MKVLLAILLAALVLIVPDALVPMNGPTMAHAVFDAASAGDGAMMAGEVWLPAHCCGDLPRSSAPLCKPDVTLQIAMPSAQQAGSTRTRWHIVSRLAVAYGIGVPQAPPKPV